MSPPLIFFGKFHLSVWVGKLNLPHLPEIHSRLKNKNVKCPKARVRWPMHHCLLTESLPQWSLIDRYHHIGPNVELTNSWAGEVPIGISLKLVAYWQGRAMHCQIAGQDLLLSNRIYWVVAAWAQEGLEELLHVQGQFGGREMITSSKVRSSGCALLEQPWRDTPDPR